MISLPRWRAEHVLITNVFPSFQPFVDGPDFGFRGRLYGRRRAGGRRVYIVEIRATKSTYPDISPLIFMDPKAGPNWRASGALCVTTPWNPARSTFAQLVLYAASYLQQKG